jgi:hypothetical protein
MIFHRSTYGWVSGGFSADLDGFVGTTPADVLSLEWSEPPTPERAAEIADANAQAQAEAAADLAAWRVA